MRIWLYRGVKCSTFWTFCYTNFSVYSSFYNVKSHTNLSLMMNEQKIAMQNFHTNSHPDWANHCLLPLEESIKYSAEWKHHSGEVVPNHRTVPDVMVWCKSRLMYALFVNGIFVLVIMHFFFLNITPLLWTFLLKIQKGTGSYISINHHETFELHKLIPDKYSIFRTLLKCWILR